jgi:hypothetical protein
MSSVIDDHLLLDLLAGTAPDWLAAEASRSDISTTTSWYYRVARAAEDPSERGALSRRLASLEPDDERSVRAQLLSLPDEYRLVPTRRLVPAMAVLGATRRLNLLSAEALATAIITESTVAVRTDSPPLRDACRALAVPYRLVT